MGLADGHACILAFDTDDRQFARGFEAGRLWTALRASPTEVVVEQVHAGNAEMLLRMAEATGRCVHTSELGGDWLEATFEPGGYF